MPWVLQTTEWRCCCNSVALSDEEEAVEVEVAVCLGSIKQKQVGGSVSTCQFRPHLKSPYRQQTAAMDGSSLDPSTLCLFDVDGTLTAPRQVAWFTPGIALPHGWKHPAPRWKCQQHFCQRKASPGFNFTFKTKWLFAFDWCPNSQNHFNSDRHGATTIIVASTNI